MQTSYIVFFSTRYLLFVRDRALLRPAVLQWKPTYLYFNKMLLAHALRNLPYSFIFPHIDLPQSTFLS